MRNRAADVAHARERPPRGSASSHMESAYRAATAQRLGYTPGRSLLELLHHPVPPAFAAGEVAEHFQRRMIRTDGRNRTGQKRFESFEIEAPGEMEIVQFTADGNKRFVLLLFLSRHFLKHHSKNRFNHIVALWVPVRKPVLEAAAIPHPGLWGGAKQQHRKELGGVARSEQVRMAIWAVWQGCWGRDRDTDSCGGQ